MSTLQRDYPPEQLAYNTLTLPSTFTQYCFAPDCPTSPFPYDKYDVDYIKKQQDEYKLGLTRYLQSRQIQYDDNPEIVTPVFNSGPFPLKTNFVLYNQADHGAMGYSYVFGMQTSL